MKKIFIILLVFSTIVVKSQSAPILIDGRFTDWTTDLATFTDVTESISGIDILQMQVSNDDNNLYIKITLDTEIDLTTNLVSQGLMLFIDADNDPSTGYPIQTGYGTELGVKFKDRFAYYNVEPFSEVSFAAIELVPLPTVTSNIFEIAIARDAVPDGVNPLFTSSSIRILFKDTSSNDSMPDDGQIFYYTFDETPVAPVELIEINKQNPESIRVVAYNTLFNGLEDVGRLPYFKNIITSLAPDIIGFSECGDANPYDIKDLLDQWLPLGTGHGWYVANDLTGDLITLSKWEIIQNWKTLYRQFPVLIDLPESYHTDLLFTNSHLRCCGANNERQEQVDDYVSFMIDAKSPGGEITLTENTPFIYAGDLNLVGYKQQLTTLLTGDIVNTETYGTGENYDWDDSEVTDQICRQTEQRMAYTWKDDTSSFPDGRLDFMIYSDAVMRVQNSFTLQTETMPNARLTQYGLSQYATSNASDHFPVICDFLPNAGLSIANKNNGITTIYPNPVEQMLYINSNNEKDYLITIYNTNGNIFFSQRITFDTKQIDVSNLREGVYFLSLTDTSKNKKWLKFIKI